MDWNLCDRHLTEDELYLLENGLSYSRLCTIDRSESITQKFFNEAQGTIRRKKSFYQSYEDQLLLNLSKNTSIVITKADKGRGVVIMSRTEYIQKLEQILSDRPKFNLLNKDPTGDMCFFGATINYPRLWLKIEEEAQNL
ncbi:unnamed protein product [Adineta steineri]|uniref:Uncharacterized protein n=1 Tax=Adineta steineri TaxID=433720 RepID=A0A818JP14_9BILA|nr:unnamed protein product [Adineta steineri]